MEMDKPEITKEQVETLLETKFIKLYDLQYEPGKHYFDATRRKKDDLVAIKSDDEFRTMLPDAVSCVVILEAHGDEPRLLLTYEYRYPAGRYLLSVPAGLLDPEDCKQEEPIVSAAIREIQEETGITITEKDKVRLINPLLFSTPGMTDESNALVCARVHLPDVSILNSEGAVGSEKFAGFIMLTKDDAKRILKNGRDEAGNFYSVYTWAALIFFVTGLFQEI